MTRTNHSMRLVNSTRWRFRRFLVDHVELRSGHLLTGSWKTCEGHLLELELGEFHSFSDVDIALRYPAPIHARKALQEHIIDYAAALSVRLSSVSIRSINAFAHLPHRWQWSTESSRKIIGPDIVAFLSFWTTISAIEADILSHKYPSVQGTKSYALSKVIFTLLRNINLVLGDHANSYRQLAELGLQLSSSFPAQRLLGVKLGHVQRLESSAVARLCSADSLQLLAPATRSNAATRSILEILDGVRRWFFDEEALEGEYLLDLAQAHATSESQLAVLDHERRKLNAVR
ncbi:MAG: hypothetical protein MN733_38560, partial [Nitrososphaera sp.]|nr:hypothetical protein [Nitrososphaera sp.]